MVSTLNVNKLTLLLLAVSFLFSCGKDSDLLDDYTSLEDSDIIDGRNFVKDDVFVLNGDNSIILDVLLNDNFPNSDNVRITSISNASWGVVEIMEDNTILYTPVVRHQESTNTSEGSEEESTEENTSEETTEEDNSSDGQADGSEEDTADGNEGSDSGESDDSTEEEGSETNEDPDSESTTDTFDYTAETENEDGTTTSEEGSVSVEYGNESTTEETEEETEEETTEEESTEEDTTEDETPPIAGNARYVTTTGKSSNDGLSENTAWSIEHAFVVAQPGQTIYVKAGSYVNKELILYQGGSAGNPIKFIGYKTTPEDTKVSNGASFKYGDQINTSLMPLFQGNAPNGRGQGMAMRIDESYVEVHNIQFTGYATAILNQGSYARYKNIIGFSLGDFRSGGSPEYSGVGVLLKGSNNKVEDSYFYNVGAEGVTLNGCNTCEVKYTEVVSDSNVNPTDYYVLFTGGTTNSVVENCKARRKSGLSHFGHGLVMKDGATNNLITKSQVFNTYIELQFANVSENLVTNCSITGRWNEDGDYAGGIMTANGAHHNTFRDIDISGVYSGIRFSDWRDGVGSPNDTNDAGNNNVYSNIQVSDSDFAIDFNEFEKLEGNAWNNEFSNCYFLNVDTMFRVNRPNSGNRVIGCTVQNVNKLKVTSSGYNYQLNGNTVFENMNWVNVGFELP